MKAALFFVCFLGFALPSLAQHQDHNMPHEMQHGFVLATNDAFASHLVATGHHSWQAEVTGQLMIEDQIDLNVYQERKLANVDGKSYFLFQAQALDLPSIKAGQVLTGHIVQSTVGMYEPRNIIVKKASYKIDKVLLNMENPFFGDQ